MKSLFNSPTTSLRAGRTAAAVEVDTARSAVAQVHIHGCVRELPRELPGGADALRRPRGGAKRALRLRKELVWDLGVGLVGHPAVEAPEP